MQLRWYFVIVSTLLCHNSYGMNKNTENAALWEYRNSDLMSPETVVKMPNKETLIQAFSNIPNLTYSDIRIDPFLNKTKMVDELADQELTLSKVVEIVDKHLKNFPPSMATYKFHFRPLIYECIFQGKEKELSTILTIDAGYLINNLFFND